MPSLTCPTAPAKSLTNTQTGFSSSSLTYPVDRHSSQVMSVSKVSSAAKVSLPNKWRVREELPSPFLQINPNMWSSVFSLAQLVWTMQVPVLLSRHVDMQSPGPYFVTFLGGDSICSLLLLASAFVSACAFLEAFAFNSACPAEDSFTAVSKSSSSSKPPIPNECLWISLDDSQSKANSKLSMSTPLQFVLMTQVPTSERKSSAQFWGPQRQGCTPSAVICLCLVPSAMLCMMREVEALAEAPSVNR